MSSSSDKLDLLDGVQTQSQPGPNDQPSMDVNNSFSDDSFIVDDDDNPVQPKKKRPARKRKAKKNADFLDLDEMDLIASSAQPNPDELPASQNTQTSKTTSKKKKQPKVQTSKFFDSASQPQPSKKPKTNNLALQ